MPRGQFVADLQKALQETLPATVRDLHAGQDDGQFEFSLVTSESDGLAKLEKVNVLVPDLDTYPSGHEYMIFATDDASRHISEALQSVRGLGGKSVFEALLTIASTVSSFTLDQDGDTPMVDSRWGTASPNHDEAEESADDCYDDDDDDDAGIYDSDHEAFSTHSNNKPLAGPYARPSQGPIFGSSDQKFRDRVRSDLRLARDSKFKVGTLGHLLDGGNAFVSLAIRMSKLGISDEAMEAWQVASDDYLILILHYPNGYQKLESLLALDTTYLASNIGMRVVASKKYKPTLQEAIDAFTMSKRDTVGVKMNAEDQSTGELELVSSGIRDTFISKPLVALLQERTIPVLRLRSSGLGWDSAESFYSSQATATEFNARGPGSADYEPDPINPALPDILNADHFRSKTAERSFPLLSMQFLLRHFVQCTKFCLVCHRKLENDIEAIKPYVCDSGLCLYQYMTLGFGPSIEHEIIAQPYVVDLLLSFLYNTAAMNRLKNFPDGLSIMVPPADLKSYSLPDPKLSHPYPGYPDYHNPVTRSDTKAEKKSDATIYDVGFDMERQEMIFFQIPSQCPVKRGDWIVVKSTSMPEGAELHCRVAEATFFPVISINEPILWHLDSSGKQAVIVRPIKDKKTEESTTRDPSGAPIWTNASFQVYSVNFNDLNSTNKSLAITRILNTIPDVKDMREYLLRSGRTELKTWVERISPAALSILRWCIASNRSCIMQVDGEIGGVQGTLKKQERLSGMKDYMQFRFAMGAPDKEQRFIEEVRKASGRSKAEIPTIFAWHGSSLYNWHSIIREGLHYENLINGRAYGDGVYFAKDAQTSIGYSGMHGGYSYGGGGNAPSRWASSLLQISTALALSEIANAPSEFKSCNPYYVVQHVDWIQVRYLFVQVNPKVNTLRIGGDTVPPTVYKQDPKHIPRGTSGAIVIPASALKVRKFKVKQWGHRGAETSPTKRAKLAKIFAPDPGANDFSEREAVDNSDADSVRTTQSDLDVLFGGDSEYEHETTNGMKTAVAPKGPVTDFKPGTLDFSRVPLMPMPTYAVSGTTKRLLKDLRDVKNTQDISSPAELGWYIDVGKIENVYQWIVEMHSFHTFEIHGKPLPLVEDMKKKSLKAIVLELRFNKDFPYTPPYVRVIRPRFRSLAQGGGGHIVLGGAMCMELLTNTGWSSVSSIESVLMQIRLAIASEPFARLDLHSKDDYGTGEAADGYIRACMTHGWEVPPGFKEMAYGGV